MSAFTFIRDNYLAGSDVLQFLNDNGLTPQFARSLPRARGSGSLYAAFGLNKTHRTRFGLDRDAVLVLMLHHGSQPLWFADEARKILDDPELRTRLTRTAVLVFSADPTITRKCNQVTLDLLDGADSDQTPSHRTALVPFTLEQLASCSGRSERERVFDLAFRTYSFKVPHFDTRNPVPDDLFGRARLLRELETDLRRRDAGIALLGIRRVGKTTVLRATLKALRTPDERWFHAYYDAQQHGEAAAAKGIEQLYQALRRDFIHAKGKPPNNLGRMPNGIDPQQALKELTEFVLREQASNRVVFAIDEFEHIVPDPQRLEDERVKNYLAVVGVLRDLKQQHRGRVAVIVCGINETFTEETHYLRMQNRAMDWFHCRYVQPMDLDDFSLMLSTIGYRVGVKFGAGALERLHHDWGGHPYLARQFCNHLTERLDPPVTLNVDDLSPDGAFRKRAGTIFTDILRHLRFFYPGEYQLLREFAKGPPIEHLEHEADEHLIQYGLVDKRGKITIEELRRFLQRKGDSVPGRRFHLGRLVGEGGQGAVFEAVDQETGMRCAAKVYNQYADGGEEAAKREYQMLKSAIALGAGQYIAAPIGFFEHDTAWLLAMEWVEGKTLQTVLEARAQLKEDDLRELAAALFTAVEALHPENDLALSGLHPRDAALISGQGNKMWHRDLKPSNVILEGSDFARVRILDFGVSAMVCDASTTRLGSEDYLPEDAGRRPWDATFDLYAVGRILWRCAIGPLCPYGQITNEFKRAIRSPGRKALLDFFKTALAPNGDARFQSVKEMRDAWSLCCTPSATGGAPPV